jgi:hypothetical protein
MKRTIGPLLLALLACRERHSSRPVTVDTALVYIAPGAPRGDARLRVSVTRDAKVFADGQEVTPSRLDSLLNATRAVNGGVWLYQDTAARRLEPGIDSTFKRVQDDILDHQLPIWIAYKSDFSDLAAKLKLMSGR